MRSAELIPSNELALISPAASPMRNTPSLPEIKSRALLGLVSRQASILTASPKDFGQAVAMAFTNPGAIFVMFALFAFFGLAKDEPHTWKIVPLILSVSLGSMTYWFFMSWLISKFQNIFAKIIMQFHRLFDHIQILLFKYSPRRS